MRDFVFLGLVSRMGFLHAGGSDTSITVSHKLSAEIPSNLRPASNELFTALVLLCQMIRLTVGLQPVLIILITASLS